VAQQARRAPSTRQARPCDSPQTPQAADDLLTPPFGQQARKVKNTEIARRMSDPTVLGLGHDRSPAAARRSLPLSLPPRLVDTAVVVLLGLLYAGYVVGNVLTLRGWMEMWEALWLPMVTVSWSPN
jgi:hypothetical protein